MFYIQFWGLPRGAPFTQQNGENKSRVTTLTKTSKNKVCQQDLHKAKI